MSSSSSLAETLAALDSLPALRESLRLKDLPATWQGFADHWTELARHSLETQAVIQEHRYDVPHRCPDELRWLRLMDSFTKIPEIDLTLSNQKLFDKFVFDLILVREWEPYGSYAEFLLQLDDVDPSIEDNAPLFFCVHEGFINEVRLLLQSPRFNIDDSRVAAAFDQVIGLRKSEVFKMLLKHPRFIPTYSLLENVIKFRWINGFDILLRDGRVDPGDILNQIIGNLDYFADYYADGLTYSHWKKLQFEFGSRLLRDGRAIFPHLTPAIISHLSNDLLELLVKDPRMDEELRMECVTRLPAKPRFAVSGDLNWR